MNYYPAFLNLQDRLCVVIGGGLVAEGKVQGLLDAEARITVISPELTPNLSVWRDEGRLLHVKRSYQFGDLAGAFLAISATDDRAANQHVWQEATARCIPVNVVDDPTHCTFIAPSIMRRGDLAIAVSTGGKAPTLAVRVREQLEHQIGDEYARFLELAGAIREPLAAQQPDFARRKELWYRLVDSDVLEQLRRGDEQGARDRITEIMGVVLDPG